MDTKYCATSVLFRFQWKYHQTSPNLKILTIFWSEYILKTDAVLYHLPAKSYAKFAGSHKHSEAVIVVSSKFLLQKAGLYSEGFGQCK